MPAYHITAIASAHEKRFLKPLIDSLLHPKPVGASPAQLSVNLDQLLKDDCKHPLAANYHNTLKQLNVDLGEFMWTHANSTEVKLGMKNFALIN